MKNWHTLAGVLVALSTFATAEAHKGWFLDTAPYPLHLNLFLQLLPLGMTVLAVLAVALLAGFQRFRGGRGVLPAPDAFGATPHRMALLYGVMPLLLALHVAIPLAINAMQRHLFVPGVPMSLSVLDLLELGIALALAYGVFTRSAAVALALLWLLGTVLVGLRPMLENAQFLGFAGFFFFAGRGPVSIDRLLFPRLEPGPAQMRWAVMSMRLGVAVSLITVAFTEKLANLPYALAFLQQYPLNFFTQVGVPLPDTLFVVGAGGVELGLGLLLLFNVFPREVSAGAWVFFNLTLSVFNVTELINHLPFFAAMLMLLLWQPGERSQAVWKAGLQDTLLPGDTVAARHKVKASPTTPLPELP